VPFARPRCGVPCVGPSLLGNSSLGLLTSASPDRRILNTRQFRPWAKRLHCAASGDWRNVTSEGEHGINRCSSTFGAGSMPLLGDMPTSSRVVSWRLARRFAGGGAKSRTLGHTEPGRTAELGGRGALWNAVDIASRPAAGLRSSWRIQLQVVQQELEVDRLPAPANPAARQAQLTAGPIFGAQHTATEHDAPSPGRSASSRVDLRCPVAPPAPANRHPGHLPAPDESTCPLARTRSGLAARESAGIGRACHGFRPRLSPRPQRPCRPAAAIGGRGPPARVTACSQHQPGQR